ncbi:unnamed protein product, partial [Chrysoparadoxa australica]
MFEKSLQDLVKGIRTHKRDPSAFISQAIAEIKGELKSQDPFVKAQAIRKLTYLQMIGYDTSWSAFSVVELMTSARFAHKRMSYLCANQTFSEETDVVLLCTNHLRKEISRPNMYDIGLAVNCLANIATPDMARDLLSEVVQLLSHQKAYVRKKALLVMYKMFIKYPQGLRLCFERVKECLDDSDNSVVSCAVNIICELSHRNPKNYLSLAPKFFNLLTTSSNNWMLIKVVKLLGSLVPEEPRLARKLLEPLATIIQNTAAKSLLYECIHTVSLALPYSRKSDGSESRGAPAVVKLCSEHLRQFVEDADQNLKYLGLVGLVDLMASHPRAVAEHRGLILACLSDNDVTIRTKALELLTGMVTKRTLPELISQLLEHIDEAEDAYRDELISKILFICSRDKYSYLEDFRWYLDVLLHLARLERASYTSRTITSSGELLGHQLIELTVRVESVRPAAVKELVGLVLEEQESSSPLLAKNKQVSLAAAWVVGEYSSNLAAGSNSSPWMRVCSALLGRDVREMPPAVQCVCIQAALKLFSQACTVCKTDGDISALIGLLIERLPSLCCSPHTEVQERACTMRALLTTFGILPVEGSGFLDGLASPQVQLEDEAEDEEESSDEGEQEGATRALDLLNLGTRDLAESILGDPEATTVNTRDKAQPEAMILSADAISPAGPVSQARAASRKLAALFAEPLKPVNPRAQAKVPPPEDLSLVEPINPAAWEEFTSKQSWFDQGKPSFTKDPRDQYEDVVGSTQGPWMEESPSPDTAEGQFDIAGEDKIAAPTDSALSEQQQQDVGLPPSSDPFYLGRSPAIGGGHSRTMPSHKSLESSRVSARSFDLEADEDYAGASKPKPKLKHRRKRKGSTGYTVNTEEMMPAGAEYSSDEGLGGHRHTSRTMRLGSGSKHSAHGTGTSGSLRSRDDKGLRRQSSHEGQDMDLNLIDITTPLEEHETMPENRHREVPVVAASQVASRGSSSKRDGDSKKRHHKSHRKHKEHKEHKEPREGKQGKDSREHSRKRERSKGHQRKADLLNLGAMEDSGSRAAAAAAAAAGTSTMNAGSDSGMIWESDLSRILATAAPTTATSAPPGYATGAYSTMPSNGLRGAATPAPAPVANSSATSTTGRDVSDLLELVQGLGMEGALPRPADAGTSGSNKAKGKKEKREHGDGTNGSRHHSSRHGSNRHKSKSKSGKEKKRSSK